MSGTSMDGLDCGLFEISIKTNYQLDWNCLDFKTFAYSKNVKKVIVNALSGDERLISHANKKLTILFANISSKFLMGRDIDFISLHGQTILHIDGKMTKQIGSPNQLLKKLNVPVIYNFRQEEEQ